MKQSILISAIIIAAIYFSCSSQSKNKQASTGTAVAAIVGGGCESCELMYIGMPENIPATDTSAGWNEKGQKLLLKGTVYKKDGRTPAENVVIYYWQTDNNGLYSPAPGMPEKAKRHGHIRGWMKTGKEGQYALYTIRPAAYPNTDNPEHIHIVIKEPAAANEYYLDECQFADDSLLTESWRKRTENRGGNGIVKPGQSGNLQIAERNIILGLNIPDYPKEQP